MSIQDNVNRDFKFIDSNIDTSEVQKVIAEEKYSNLLNVRDQEILAKTEHYLDKLYSRKETYLFRTLKNLFRLFIALDENRILLRLLSDPNLKAKSKKILIQRLASEKVNGNWEVDHDLVEIVLILSYNNFSSEEEYLMALEDVGIDGVLFDAQKDHRLDFLEQEMFYLLDFFYEEPKLDRLLSDVSVPVRRRLKLIEDLFKGKVDKRSYALLKHATVYLTKRHFLENLIWMTRLITTKKKKIMAYVTSAQPFSDEQIKKLQDKLIKKYGTQVEIDFTIDPELIGGAKLEIESDFIDGTIRNSIKEFNAALNVGTQ